MSVVSIFKVYKVCQQIIPVTLKAESRDWRKFEVRVQKGQQGSPRKESEWLPIKSSIHLCGTKSRRHTRKHRSVVINI